MQNPGPADYRTEDCHEVLKPSHSATFYNQPRFIDENKYREFIPDVPVAYQSNKMRELSNKKKMPEFSIGNEVRFKHSRYDN